MVKMEWVQMVTKRTPRPRLFSFSFNAFSLLSRSAPLFRYPTTLESISPLLVFPSQFPIFRLPFSLVFFYLRRFSPSLFYVFFVPTELAVLTPFDRVR